MDVGDSPGLIEHCTRSMGEVFRTVGNVDLISPDISDRRSSNGDIFGMGERHIGV